ncbi:hypothetical protein CAOG_009463 [Capsaspora owczarzaki ATCC 30864]|uniref:Uncharacterized protein n=1 Tax=Capsaspora owczarzaki (strain ATCC 30864) TaxID=595528 RepID=A0A0D2VKB0_CAPO3|nr:hypothetical protein CAOG_009463 [Capsaspora owczarzaki ATCC 30864]
MKRVGPNLSWRLTGKKNPCCTYCGPHFHCATALLCSSVDVKSKSCQECLLDALMDSFLFVVVFVFAVEFVIIYCERVLCFCCVSLLYVASAVQNASISPQCQFGATSSQSTALSSISRWFLFFPIFPPPKTPSIRQQQWHNDPSIL